MWGMMADIDFDSEKYRKPFGGQRFLVSALKESYTSFDQSRKFWLLQNMWKFIFQKYDFIAVLKHIATLESYKGSISVVKENETKWTVIDGPFVNAIATWVVISYTDY